MIELLTVITTVGLCLSIACVIYPIYASEARLVQTLYVAQEIQTEAAVERSLTGSIDLDSKMVEEKIKITPLIKSVHFFGQENFQFELSTSNKNLNGQTIGFSIYSLNQNEFYSFQILSCGDNEAPSPYQVFDKAKTSLKPIFTHHMCAGKLNVHSQ